MKVVFRKEFKLEVDMEDLMNECIDRLEWARRRAARGLYTPCGDLEFLVQESLGYIYDIDLYDYDNTNEIVTVIAKNLLLWCVEHNFLEEYNRLEKMN